MTYEESKAWKLMRDALVEAIGLLPFPSREIELAREAIKEADRVRQPKLPTKDENNV